MNVQTQEGLVSKITLIGVAIADVIIITLSSGVLTLWSGLVGLLLLLLLLAYSEHGNVSQTRIERLLSSATLGLSTLLLFGWLLQPLYESLNLRGFEIVIGTGLFGIVWSVFAFLFWLIATAIWMRINPRKSWPRLFQMPV